MFDFNASQNYTKSHDQSVEMLAKDHVTERNDAKLLSFSLVFVIIILF